MGYVQTYLIPSGTMRNADIEEISNIILQSYRKITTNLKDIHDENVDGITRMLKNEVDFLRQDISRENRKHEGEPKEEKRPVLNADFFDKPWSVEEKAHETEPKKERSSELNADFFDHPWELEEDKKAEINRNSIQIAKKVEEDSKKMPQENVLPDDLIK